jgi:hypothetical protein
MRLPRLALLASLAGACGSPVDTTTPPPPLPLTGAAPFVVSNPVTNGAASIAPAGSSGLGPLTFISLPPGTLPGGTVVRIRVERTGAVLSAALFNGGLDPVAVPAAAGDTISLSLERSDGTTSVFRFVVSNLRMAPVIVRTQPEKNKRDVPLNIRIQVVFSEPIDPISLTPQNFELRSGSAGVAGQLNFANGDHTTVEFTPAAELAVGTEYELVLRPGIRDLDGTPLDAAASISFTTTEAPPGAAGFGSVTGAYRGSGGWYPTNGNGLPSDSASWWPILSIVATAPGQPSRFARREKGPAPFEFDGLPAGTWTLIFSGMHPWPGVFPEMRLYADTMISVTVLANQTVVLPEMVLRPVAPFVVIATEICPSGFSGPPTFQDWGDCDSGYWGGVDVAVEVQGIAGTATAGIRYSLSIPSYRWFVELHDVPLGEYEVDVVPVRSGWRLLPWQSSPVRLRVDQGLSYAEFDFWFDR